jgi:hypothetical protein
MQHRSSNLGRIEVATKIARINLDRLLQVVSHHDGRFREFRAFYREACERRRTADRTDQEVRPKGLTSL